MFRIPSGSFEIKRQQAMEAFWLWYERHYTVNLVGTAALFTLQLVHLYWMTTHVVAFGLLGRSFFNPPPFWQYMIIIVDYTEIPSLLSTSVFYLYELRKGHSAKYVLYLFLLNSQWLHLFWITDSFVLNTFHGVGTGTLPVWLAWPAVFIDYLELPVIFETLWKAIAGPLADAINRRS